MDTIKVRELVNKAEASVDADNPTETYQLLDAIRHELDKAQQPGKVLTHEEIERIKQKLSLPKGQIGWSDEELHARWRGVEVTVNYFRDNGYLAPAAGLTATWANAEELAEDPGVHSAMSVFSHDSSGDNGAGVVLAVLKAIEAKRKA